MVQNIYGHKSKKEKNNEIYIIKFKNIEISLRNKVNFNKSFGNEIVNLYNRFMTND